MAAVTKSSSFGMFDACSGINKNDLKNSLIDLPLLVPQFVGMHEALTTRDLKIIKSSLEALSNCYPNLSDNRDEDSNIIERIVELHTDLINTMAKEAPVGIEKPIEDVGCECKAITWSIIWAILGGVVLCLLFPPAIPFIVGVLAGALALAIISTILIGRKYSRDEENLWNASPIGRVQTVRDRVLDFKQSNGGHPPSSVDEYNRRLHRSVNLDCARWYDSQ